MHERRVGELIRDQQPLTMHRSATVAEACAAMHKRRVGAVLIVDEENALLGIFTGRDAVRCLAGGCDSASTMLSDVMTGAPVTIGAQQSAMDALRILSDSGFRHLPVCEDGRVIGIISRYDLRAMEHTRHAAEVEFFERLR